MKLSPRQAYLLVLFGCAFSALTLCAGEPTVRPIALTGWNADVIFEKGKASSATSFDRPNQRTNDYPLYAWFESGLEGHADGLPVSRRFASASSGDVVFELQPYDTNNVLLLTSAKPSGKLTLVEPAVCRSLFLLVAGGGGESRGSLQLRFTDGTESASIPFAVPDWWTSFEGKVTKTPAITGLGRSNGQNEFQYEEYGDNGFGLFQAKIDLATAKLDSKLIESISLKKEGGGATAGIFAISGERSKASGK